MDPYAQSQIHASAFGPMFPHGGSQGFTGQHAFNPAGLGNSNMDACYAQPAAQFAMDNPTNAHAQAQAHAWAQQAAQGAAQGHSAVPSNLPGFGLASPQPAAQMPSPLAPPQSFGAQAPAQPTPPLKLRPDGQLQ